MVELQKLMTGRNPDEMRKSVLERLKVPITSAKNRADCGWALPDSNQRSPGIPFRGPAARLLPTEI